MALPGITSALSLAELTTETVTFIEFIYEEALQTESMALYLAVKHNFYDKAKQVLDHVLEHTLPKAYAFVNTYGYLAPWTQGVFLAYYDSALEQLKMYHHLIYVSNYETALLIPYRTKDGWRDPETNYTASQDWRFIQYLKERNKYETPADMQKYDIILHNLTEDLHERVNSIIEELVPGPILINRPTLPDKIEEAAQKDWVLRRLTNPGMRWG